MAMDTRAAAARVLAEVLAGKSLNQALPSYIEKVAPRDKGLLQQLCYGTLRQAPRLQGLLAQLLDKPLRDKDRDIQGLLLCGLYQLEDTRIPDHAAVSATVGATKVLKKPWARGMSNAVLRRFLRERDTLITALGPAALAAHPQWLVDSLQQQWPHQAESVIAANNTQPPMTLRVNSAKGNRESYLSRLEDAGIEATAGHISPHAIYLLRPVDVGELPGFAEGDVSVQDEAAQMAALLLDAQPGERVLDACAAPGGKTCHVLETQSQLGEMVAMDIDAARLEKVSENLTRLGLKAQLSCSDAATLEEQWDGGNFDRILVDAPCSASGVIRRHPDVKLLRRETDSAALGRRQLEILNGLWALLKPKGRLLYATCSILEEENSTVIAGFLDTAPDAELIQITADWGHGSAFGRQLLPSPGGPDGLFYALLTKTS